MVLKKRLIESQEIVELNCGAALTEGPSRTD